MMLLLDPALFLLAINNQQSFTPTMNFRQMPTRRRLLIRVTGSGLGRLQTGPNLNFKFEFRKMKKFQKISKNTSSCDESNGVKNFQIFVHLVYFTGI